MGSFEINSAELGTIISQYQRIGRDLSNYSGRIRREVQRLNSQKGFGIETVRSNLTHLSSNSNAHSRDAYIFGGFLKDLETESTNAENQVSKGMYDATPTKMSLTQLVAGALAILVGFVFSKPLIAPIAAWLAALIAKGKSTGMPNTLPTPGLTPKPAFPPDSKPSTDEGSTAKPIPVPVPIPIPIPTPAPKPSVDPSTGGVTDGTTGTEEPAPAKPETPQVPEPITDPNAGNIKDGGQISREGDLFQGDGIQFGGYKGQCTWYVAARVQQITGKKIQFSEESGNDAKNWVAGGIGTEDARIVNGAKVDIPKPGTIMVRTSGDYGHVAIVEKVTEIKNAAGEVIDYEILYSEANSDGNNWVGDDITGYSIQNDDKDGIVVSEKLSDLGSRYSLVDLV